MKVYILMESIDYEGDNVIAIFSSREKANKALKESVKNYTGPVKDIKAGYCRFEYGATLRVVEEEVL